MRAAVKVQKDLDFMATCGFRPADTGIGINTGRTIMGFIGTETRMSPTVCSPSYKDNVIVNCVSPMYVYGVLPASASIMGVL